MENTIILLQGFGEIWHGLDLNKVDIEKLAGSTIWGDNNCPKEIKRWSIDQKEEAKEELAKYRCSYRVMDGNVGKIIDAEEYALEYCTYDEDGEYDFMEGSDYDLAEIEWINLRIFDDIDFEHSIPFNKVEKTLLKSVTIDDGVTYIDDCAFEDCKNLTSVSIPDSVKEIGEDAFAGCDKLKYTIYDNGKYLGNENNPYVAFIGTIPGYITSCQIHENTKAISPHAFEHCSGLTNITIPNGVTCIGEKTFSGCRSLTNITIPDSVTEIESSAFDFCYDLKSINKSGDNGNYRFIDGNLCSKDGETLIKYVTGKTNTSFSIPNGVKNVGDYAFSGCGNLKNITIPDSVTSIGNYAFENCENLTSVTIPDSVTSIGDYAFRSCSSLTSVTIPDSVTSIGYGAFECYSKLTISCSKGSHAEKYAKSNDINVTIVPKTEQVAVNPDKAEKAAKKKPHHL